jgi:type VI secretion system secreted protein VgrG
MPQPVSLTTPLPSAALSFLSMSARLSVSALDEIELDLLSPKPQLRPEDFLAQPMGVHFGLRDEGARHFHGLVTRFGIGQPQAGSSRLFAYRATLRPWLWFLTRSANCRVFQELTVPEIVEAVFADFGAIANHKVHLVRTYRKRDYCVQYRETAFNFVARLLEEEGIWWFFEHRADEHVLHLVDDFGALQPAPGNERLPYFANIAEAPPDLDLVDSWSFTREVRSGAVALSAFDFERPLNPIGADVTAVHEHPLADLELFDYEGEAFGKDDALQLAVNRVAEESAQFERPSGRTNAHGLGPGFSFKLHRHPRDDQNDEYMCLSAAISAQAMQGESGGSAGHYTCNFTATRTSLDYSPPRRTPKPFVQGPQTAVVTGPAGEEIFTDKYSRVKVQFHWDRRGKKDAKSSCWVRVSTPWAGRNFGFVQIPRIGQEVVVDFLEGDPDQPIITGRVYNADQMPPWQLPANATQSGIHTRSSKGGDYGNANTLRFEDKKGHEQVLIHAEKDMSTSVENDQSTSVGHDQSTTVKNSQTTTVEKGRKVFVKSLGETYYVKDDRKIYVDAKQEQVVTKDFDTWVKVNMGEYVTGDRKAVTTGKFIFKATEAHFNAGPKWFAMADDVQMKSAAKTTLQAGTDFALRATDFKISATNNINFTGNQFNRTIFEGNDTVLGNNTNTYIGSSRSTTMGPSVEVYSGFKNATNVGIATEASLAVNISSFIGLSISNALSVSMDNALLNLGMTGFDLTVSGMSIDQNAMKLLVGGGGAAGGAATMFTGGAGIAALIAAGVGLAVGVGFGGAAAADAHAQGNDDVDALLNNPALTPAVRARLQRALDSRFTHSKAEGGPESAASDPVMSGQLDSLANAAVPGLDAAGSPASGAAAPAAPADPSAGH